MATHTLHCSSIITNKLHQIRLAVRVDVHRPLCTSTKWNTPPTCLNKSRSSIVVTAGGSGYPWTTSTPETSSKYQVSPSTQKLNGHLLNEQQHDDDDQNTTLPPTRPFTNFHPDVWGDGFLNRYIPEDNADIKRAFKEAEIEQLKKRVTNELLANSAATAPLADKRHILNLINHIQRLGLAYHFETEIEQTLQHVYETSLSSDDEDDLYTFSLRFRLLRQQGFDSSPDGFNQFRDDVNGKFKESLTADTKGMLSLYEASYFGKPEGDEILDEALAFTTNHLTSVVAAVDTSNNSSRVNDPLVPEIIHALKVPILKNVPRLEARRYIPVYEQDVSHDKDLLKLAKLDFNLLQSLHKQELADLVRWWKDLEVEKNFPYARHRIVELYVWSYGVKFEPQYHFARMILTKLNGIATLLDDTYDSYGTWEELQLFTKAIERWSFDCLDQLPENLKQLYHLLLDTCEEFEQGLERKLGPSDHINYTKKAIKGFTRAYLQEAKWRNEGHVPTMDEYMRNAVVTSLYYYMPISFIIGMGMIDNDVSVTDEALKWFDKDTTILLAGAYICRILNDISTREREPMPTAVEIYAKQYNVCEKEAVDELYLQVDKAWKIHNEVFVRKPVPLTMLNVVLNLSRNVHVVHLDEKDEFTFVSPGTQETIKLLLVKPVQV